LKFGLVVREMVLDAVGTLGVDVDKDLTSFLCPGTPVLLMPRVGERWHRAEMIRKVIEGDSVEVGCRSVGGEEEILVGLGGEAAIRLMGFVGEGG
jgi:hypothetical protein